jgi:hypothetical protein
LGEIGISRAKVKFETNSYLRVRRSEVSQTGIFTMIVAGW